MIGETSIFVTNGSEGRRRHAAYSKCFNTNAIKTYYNIYNRVSNGIAFLFWIHSNWRAKFCNALKRFQNSEIAHMQSIKILFNYLTMIWLYLALGEVCPYMVEMAQRAVHSSKGARIWIHFKNNTPCLGQCRSRWPKDSSEHSCKLWCGKMKTNLSVLSILFLSQDCFVFLKFQFLNLRISCFCYLCISLFG